MTPRGRYWRRRRRRRRELLTLIGIAHTVMPADIDETPLPGEQPRPHAERLARGKATVVADREPNAVVIAADTIVVVDGDILGKPRDDADAAIMLRRLSGRRHLVLTAVAVARGGRLVSDVESVDVTFRDVVRRGHRALHRDPRANGQGWRVRHPGLRRDDRRRESTATISR